jgi:hypothetical protein
MRKSEMALKMARYYTTRYCMVEQGYITSQEFFSEMLNSMEGLGMLPPPFKKYWIRTNSADQYVNSGFSMVEEWEPENETK